MSHKVTHHATRRKRKLSPQEIVAARLTRSPLERARFLVVLQQLAVWREPTPITPHTLRSIATYCEISQQQVERAIDALAILRIVRIRVVEGQLVACVRVCEAARESERVA